MSKVGAFFLGFFFPGLGFATARRPKAAIAAAGVVVLLAPLMLASNIWLLGPRSVAVFSGVVFGLGANIIQAVLGARAVQRCEEPAPIPKRLAFALVVAVLAFGARQMLRYSVVEAFTLPTTAMAPGYPAGSHVFVSKLAYGVRIPLLGNVGPTSSPARGDVVVYEFPVAEAQTRVVMGDVITPIIVARNRDREFARETDAVDAWGNVLRVVDEGDEIVVISDGPDRVPDSNDDLRSDSWFLIGAGDRSCVDPAVVSGDVRTLHMHRVVAVGGDTLWWDDGELYIDDVEVVSEVVESTDSRPGSPPRIILEETIDRGLSHEVVVIAGRNSEMEPYTVREGYVFVAGDNRAGSADSRCFGEIPLSHIRGRAAPAPFYVEAE